AGRRIERGHECTRDTSQLSLHEQCWIKACARNWPLHPRDRAGPVTYHTPYPPQTLPLRLSWTPFGRDSSCPGALRWRSVIGETRSLITRNLSNGCGGIPANQKIWRNISINYTSHR